MSRLLAPRSIAVVGGAPAERVIRQCRLLGFEGPIWPVNPRRSTLAGVPCVPTLDDLPGVPDAVFLGVNRHASVEAMRTIAALGRVTGRRDEPLDRASDSEAHREDIPESSDEPEGRASGPESHRVAVVDGGPGGVGGVVCYGSGFAEAGEGDLQAALIEAAGDIPFFGPNCYGYVNTFDRVALWPDEHGCGVFERGVAIVSQSGNVACNLTYAQRGVRLGGMVTVGNQASLGMEDCIDAFLDDDRITTIGLFLEAVRDPQRFARSAIRAAEQGVPIVALQTARSATGAAIAASHTGSMAGRAAAYDALFQRYGVAVVRTPAELLETLKLLDQGGRLSGPRVVSLSCSGGEASLVADRSEGTKLRFEPFPTAQQQRIEATLTELVSVSNPFDYHTFMWGDRAATAACFTAVMDGPQDATMLVLDAPTGGGQDNAAWYTAIDALGDAAAATGSRGVVVASMGENLDAGLRAHATAAGLTPLLGLTEGLVALEAAATVGRTVGSLHAPVAQPATTRLIDEAAAKGRLRHLGVTVPDGLVVSADEVRNAAAQVGFPVTLKALGLAHKSESSAVKVGLRDAAALESALAQMPATEPGYLVESTVTDVVAEVLVAVRRDPPIGWLVSVGFGGVMTEIWADVAHLLAPVTVDDVRGALQKLRSYRMLTGFRGRPAADIDALCALVVRLAESVVGSEVVEVELNPVLVGSQGAIAVDALWVETVAAVAS